MLTLIRSVPFRADKNTCHIFTVEIAYTRKFTRLRLDRNYACQCTSIYQYWSMCRNMTCFLPYVYGWYLLTYQICGPVVGVTEPICHTPSFSKFSTLLSVVYLFDITLIFDSCRRSSAAVTLIKYEWDLKYQNSNFIYLKISITRKFLNEIYNKGNINAPYLWPLTWWI